MTFYAVLKNPVMTKIMQSAGLFETTKFIGQVVQLQTSGSMDVKSTFAHVSRMNRPECECVGIIMESGERFICPGHKVISNGAKFSVIDHA